jgi:hypothetical protein
VARKKDSPESRQDASIRKRLTNTALYPSAVLFVIVVCILAALGGPAVYSKIVATGVQQVSIPAIRALAAEFLLLIDGAMVTALRERTPAPAHRAKAIATRLLG